MELYKFTKFHYFKVLHSRGMLSDKEQANSDTHAALSFAVTKLDQHDFIRHNRARHLQVETSLRTEKGKCTGIVFMSAIHLAIISGTLVLIDNMAYSLEQ
jgi:hypothetical protein